jgi:hypothetical protein
MIMGPVNKSTIGNFKSVPPHRRDYANSRAMVNALPLFFDAGDHFLVFCVDRRGRGAFCFRRVAVKNATLRAIGSEMLATRRG